MVITVHQATLWMDGSSVTHAGHVPEVMEKNGMVLLGNGSEEGTVRYGIVRP